MWDRSSVKDIRIVHGFDFFYTPCFHIVEYIFSQDNHTYHTSIRDTYSHKITVHVTTSDCAGSITNYDILFIAGVDTNIRAETRCTR